VRITNGIQIIKKSSLRFPLLAEIPVDTVIQFGSGETEIIENFARFLVCNYLGFIREVHKNAVDETDGFSP
jgi:hypothetical protein